MPRFLSPLAPSVCSIRISGTSLVPSGRMPGAMYTALLRRDLPIAKKGRAATSGEPSGRAEWAVPGQPARFGLIERRQEITDAAGSRQAVVGGRRKANMCAT